MNSLIYTGTIEHRRFAPITHQLSYPIYMYGFDLEDLPHLGRRYPLFGYNRKAITSIHDKDYLQPGDMPIKQKIDQLLDQHNVKESIQSVMMITSARYFNYVFNPANFHYCFSADNRLATIIAEVNNTYGERHPYVLTQNTHTSPDWLASYQATKAFHVSPFNKIEGHYRFYFSAPENQINIRIELVRDRTKVMEAVLRAQAIPFTGRNHLKTLAKHPFAPHLSVPRIYYHTFRLFFQKRLKFNDKPLPRSPITMPRQTPNLLESISKRLILSVLKKMNTGSLDLQLPNKKTMTIGRIDPVKDAVIQIKDFSFFPRIVFDGEIGLGEAYMAGEWDSPDLVAALTRLIENRDRFGDGNLLLSILTRIQEKLAHDRRKNTIENTPGNIAAHYDLSNEMYALFLDQKMLYSCGLFLQNHDTLEIAQTNKMNRILKQADIGPGQHLLEIGCGWGGFAVFAAKKTGCRVTGITVSKAQYQRARQRVKAEGLEDQITILLQDYRHTRGNFDRIVSIEMIEAVGPQFLGQYFRQCKNLLHAGGKMVFQAITIVDERYDQYCKERDWIQKHIFPGGHLPCLNILEQTIHDHTDFTVTDIYHMGPHYATTLSRWRERFAERWDDIIAMGFDKTFYRKWMYYFSICEAGFITGGIDDIQVTLQR
ncbi:DUF1365 family protein [Desulfobacula sp.]|uniref:DUF1365 family protein n=1 Tax=Desulfobacula sp. TaxID=2593537 RepID=UPI00262F2D64|nr:DUF1365 family protein [Desulfobacula sp.]